MIWKGVLRSVHLKNNNLSIFHTIPFLLAELNTGIFVTPLPSPQTRGQTSWQYILHCVAMRKSTAAGAAAYLTA